MGDFLKESAIFSPFKVRNSFLKPLEAIVDSIYFLKQDIVLQVNLFANIFLDTIDCPLVETSRYKQCSGYRCQYIPVKHHFPIMLLM